ncbi:MAG TPA: hypothetical protein VGP72_19215 [Planctomycetota bacterium]|jgi:hypothetical protein
MATNKKPSSRAKASASIAAEEAPAPAVRVPAAEPVLRVGKRGFFVSFAYTSDALTEVDAFFRKSGKIIIPLTVSEILEERLAQKLA